MKAHYWEILYHNLRYQIMAQTGVPKPTKKQIEDLKKRFDGKCHGYACNKSVMHKWKVEHLKPRTKGGDDSTPNLLMLCESCAGRTSRTYTLPVHLLNSAKRWVENNPDVDSVTQLIRIAIESHITDPEERHSTHKLLEQVKEQNERLELLANTVQDLENRCIQFQSIMKTATKQADMVFKNKEGTTVVMEYKGDRFDDDDDIARAAAA